MRLESPAFAAGAPIPRRHAGDGDNVSPPLSFIEAPAAAHELALTCVDPDAPGGPWTHWSIRAIPASCAGLAEGLPRRQVAAGARQGLNGWGALGWGGPLPPPGPAHRYVFTLTALDRAGKVLAQASLTGTYQRGR